MEHIVHRAKDRGKGDYGWLQTRYSFSFANWYDPARMGFGVLRVINDDIVAPDTGFDMHRHQDMEIITIVTKGAVTHTDSLGNSGTVAAGEVQAMSAGTGVIHAERNGSKTEPLELFQIWIEPDRQGVPPRYAQRTFPEDRLALLASPDGRDGSLPLHQQAYLWRATLDRGESLAHALADSAHGAYVFVISGTLDVAGQKLGARDAMGLWDTASLSLAASERASFFMIEVPLA